MPRTKTRRPGPIEASVTSSASMDRFVELTGDIRNPELSLKRFKSFENTFVSPNNIRLALTAPIRDWTIHKCAVLLHNNLHL